MLCWPAGRDVRGTGKVPLAFTFLLSTPGMWMMSGAPAVLDDEVVLKTEARRTEGACVLDYSRASDQQPHHPWTDYRQTLFM